MTDTSAIEKRELAIREKQKKKSSKLCQSTSKLASEIKKKKPLLETPHVSKQDDEELFYEKIAKTV